MNRDEIFEKVQEVLEEALGVDEDEITPQASLTRDLEAESIDYLDIQFRLEKTFSTDNKPFKIEQGELFPENFMEEPRVGAGQPVHRSGDGHAQRAHAACGLLQV